MDEREAAVARLRHDGVCVEAEVLDELDDFVIGHDAIVVDRRGAVLVLVSGRTVHLPPVALILFEIRIMDHQNVAAKRLESGL